MPRVRKPELKQLLANPRAYALWAQLSPAEDGTVTHEAWDQLMCSEDTSGTDVEELTFDEFAAMFSQLSTQSKEGEGNCIGWAALNATSPLVPWRFDRRALRPTDVRIQIAYCGICHSDIHMAKNEWGMSTFPMVPGHEIVGIVTAIGSEVTTHKVGDRVGVGCMVNSCQKCDACLNMKEEQFCPGVVYTYGFPDTDGTVTYGGYSTHVLVDEKFVLRVPDTIPLERAAPLLCAGITTYSPIKHYGFDKPGMHVGVAGLGGLGHMAVQFLKAMGVHTTIISTSPHKRDEALKVLKADSFVVSTDVEQMQVLKADSFVVSTDVEQMQAAAGTLDGILDTIPATHDLTALMSLMKVGGTCVCVGLPSPAAPPMLPTLPLIFRRQRIGGSPIGGIQQTQEMLDFCAEHGISCLTELISAEYVNQAYERIIKGDVRYRFVIDIQGSLIA